jgi:hypothetical protein
MSLLMMVENGKVFWQCEECDLTFFNGDEVAYGHDCEV